MEDKKLVRFYDGNASFYDLLKNIYYAAMMNVKRYWKTFNLINKLQ